MGMAKPTGVVPKQLIMYIERDRAMDWFKTDGFQNM